MSDTPRVTPTAPPEPGMRAPLSAVDVLAFVCEIFAFATLAIWGFAMWPFPWNIVVGIGAPVVAILVWALFVSPRHLHAVLAEAGRTVAGTVRERRLAHCLADLADPAQAADPVSAIARRRGFTNPTRFGQLVREHTGRTPTAYRRDALR